MSDRPKWLQYALDFVFDILPTLATIGVAVVLIWRQQVSSDGVSTDDLLSGVLAVLGLLAISEIIERYRCLRGIQASTEEAVRLTRNRFADRPSALTYFRKSPDLQLLVQRSNKIDLCGVCLTSTVNTLFSALRKRLNTGAAVRVLVMAPGSQAVEMAGFRSEMGDARYYQRRLDATFQDLEYIHRSWRNSDSQESGQLQVRLLKYPPSFGLCAFDSDRPQGVVLVEVYPHKSASESPILELRSDRDGKWYQYFSEQFERMWRDATQWDPSDVFGTEDAPISRL
jgi:hypothetical protein